MGRGATELHGVPAIPSFREVFGRASVIAATGATAVIVISLLDLIGWLADVAVLRSFIPGRTPMQPVTAVGLMVAAASLLLLLPAGVSRSRRVTGRAAALVVSTIGIVVLLEYTLGAPLGVDLTIPPGPSWPLATPGRPALPTALAFVLVGLALLLLDAGRWQRLFSGLLFGIATIFFLGIASHLFGISGVYQVGGTFPFGIALNTAFAFLLLCVWRGPSRAGWRWCAAARSAGSWRARWWPPRSSARRSSASSSSAVSAPGSMTRASRSPSS